MSFDEFLGMEAKLIYLMAVLIIASYLLFWGLWVIRREKRRRLDQVKEMDYTEAVLADPAHPEEIDIDSHNVINRKHAVQGIESRFEFMQKFYIPLVLFITILLVGLPFLPALPATYLSLLTGVIAGIIGLAARPVIENAIAGMVLTFSQPIRINDTVILDGQYGTVEKINLLHTTIKIWNWRRLVIPNNKLLEKEIENLTLGDESEWAYIAFYVEPSVDINLVKKLSKEAMNSPHRNKSEECSFWIMEMEKDAILCWVAGWADDPARAWALKSGARKNLIKKFKDNKISFQMAKSKIELSTPTKIPAEL